MYTPMKVFFQYSLISFFTSKHHTAQNFESPQTRIQPYSIS